MGNKISLIGISGGAIRKAFWGWKAQRRKELGRGELLPWIPLLNTRKAESGLF